MSEMFNAERGRVVAQKLAQIGYSLIDRHDGSYSILDGDGNTVHSELSLEAAEEAAEEAAVDLRRDRGQSACRDGEVGGSG